MHIQLQCRCPFWSDGNSNIDYSKCMHNLNSNWRVLQQRPLWAKARNDDTQGYPCLDNGPSLVLSFHNPSTVRLLFNFIFAFSNLHNCQIHTLNAFGVRMNGIVCWRLLAAFLSMIAFIVGSAFSSNLNAHQSRPCHPWLAFKRTLRNDVKEPSGYVVFSSMLKPALLLRTFFPSLSLSLVATRRTKNSFTNSRKAFACLGARHLLSLRLR